MQSIASIRECIARLRESFASRPAMYFNESDLQSELFALLLDRFGDASSIANVFVWGTSAPKRTRQCISRRLHSELLLPEGRIDLALLDMAHVRLALNSRGRFGHIQLEKGNHVFIEIKASRTNRSRIRSRRAWKNLILSDIKKLNNYTHTCFLLCFDFNSLLTVPSVACLKRRANPNVELLYFESSISDNYCGAPSAGRISG